MTDNLDLQAQIAALAGRINRHKSQGEPPVHHSTPYIRGRYGGYRGRWQPSAPRQTYKHKTLVLAKSAAEETKHNDGAPVTQDTAVPTNGTAFVKAHGTNNQVMTATTFEREQKAKALLKPHSTAVTKQHLYDHHANHKLERLTRASLPSRNSRIIEVEGLKFTMKEDGSKLVRIQGETERVNTRGG